MTEPSDRSKPFRSMADRVDLNAKEEFGGAGVIIPPGDGPLIELLLLDPKQSEGAFWGVMKAKIEMAIAECDERERRQQGNQFGRR